MPRKLMKFLILFDNTNLLFFPGQFLSGRVLLELQEDTPALGLHFHVVGEGVVTAKTARQERTYDKENYIDFRMRLLGDADSGPTILSPGIHSFPFKLGLPLGLPSTFLGRHGWIQYYCKCALRENSGLIHKNHQIFIIMNPIDLNIEEPSLAEPFRCEIEPTLGGFACISSGSVKCKIELDRGGYVSGENIVINGYVKNFSKVTIRHCKIVLLETIQYLSRGKIIQTEKRELAQIKFPKIRPNSRDEFVNKKLYVPPLPPTNIRNSNIIRLNYDVYLIIEPKSMEKAIKLQLPIVLATYPFRSTNDVLTNWPDSVLKPDTHYPSSLPVFRPSIP